MRPAGDDIRAGTLVLAPGQLLGPGEIGAAIVAGRAVLRCSATPVVAVVTTGDELTPPGAPLLRGAIHESNGPALAAAAEQAGARVASRAVAGDTLGAATAALQAGLAGADVLVISGGVSVGPHDHVKPALAALGVEQRFWGVTLRPGKPTWFGVAGETLVFGLPGNPVSALVTFALFVAPALRELQGLAPLPERRAGTLDDCRPPQQGARAGDPRAAVRTERRTHRRADRAAGLAHAQLDGRRRRARPRGTGCR